MSDKIYYENDRGETPKERIAWFKELNASGYAGCTRDGRIVDRREFPDAIPVQENSRFGVAKPKPLPDAKKKDTDQEEKN